MEIACLVSGLPETEALAAEVGALLQPGDCLCLEGSLGVGKTAFARALLRWLFRDPALIVPSPTFSLVQDYAHPRLPCLHVDLYRLADEAEVEQLDLFDDPAALKIIEWSDRAGALLPEKRFVVQIDMTDAKEPNRRSLTLKTEGEGWALRLARLSRRNDFLAKTAWRGAELMERFGDASPRAHLKYRRADGCTALLLDADAFPDHPLPSKHLLRRVREGRPRHDDLDAYCKARDLLAEGPFALPEVLARSDEDTCLLVSDLGNLGLVDAKGAPVPARFSAAVEALARLHNQFQGPPKRAPAGLTILDAEILQTTVGLYLDHFPPSEKMVHHFHRFWAARLSKLDQNLFTYVHRDFHSPNLIWRPEARRQVGLVDFQDLAWGPCAYDLASLLWDARVTIEAPLRADLLQVYLDHRDGLGDRARSDLLAQVELMGLLWVLRLRGHFHTLAENGKPDYLVHLDRNELYFDSLRDRPSLADFFSPWEGTL